jgi:hypothetical protein
MFSEDPPFDDLLASSARRKVKKALYVKAKQQFSDAFVYRRIYYECVYKALQSSSGKDLDKQVLMCKRPLEAALKFIEDTNQHADLQLKRCLRKRRTGDNQTRTAEGEWECLNRGHRRYLFHYPRSLEKVASSRY